MSRILEETQLIKCVEHLIVVGLGKDKFLQKWEVKLEWKCRIHRWPWELPLQDDRRDTVQDSIPILAS